LERKRKYIFLKARCKQAKDRRTLDGRLKTGGLDKAVVAVENLCNQQNTRQAVDVGHAGCVTCRLIQDGRSRRTTTSIGLNNLASRRTFLQLRKVVSSPRLPSAGRPTV